MSVNSQKKIPIIIGLGKTGVSCARYLQSNAQSFIAMDTRDNPPDLSAFKQEFPTAEIYTGVLKENILLQASELIVSPGVPLETPAIAKARQAGVRVIGDIELFARAAKAPIVAITGTNAKGTVTTLTGLMAKNAGLNVKVGGNIGTPALDLLAETTVPDLYVMEISSFQLDTTYSLHPYVATILNITEDHLDRHGTMANYIAAKQRIYQHAQHAVWNRDDDNTYPAIIPANPAGIISCNISLRAEQVRACDQRGESRFSPLETPSRKVSAGTADTYLSQISDRVSFGNSDPKENEFGIRKIDQRYWLAHGKNNLMLADQMPIKGHHNWLNALAALALGTIIKLPLESMLQTLRDFKGLSHRCEWVAQQNGVDWFDDSKGTNVGATMAAIQGLGSAITGKLILIAGGRDKGADFSLLKPAVSEYVKNIVLIGQDARLIAKALDGCAPIQFAKTLAEAVFCARNAAKVGDAVLLSPVCTSFDMFKNAEDRGDQFKALVKKAD